MTVSLVTVLKSVLLKPAFVEYLPGFKKLFEKVLQRTDEIFYQQYKKMSVVKDSMRHIHGFKLYLKVSLKFSSSEPISGQSSHLYPLKTPENLWFIGVFRVYEKGALTRNDIIKAG